MAFLAYELPDKARKSLMRAFPAASEFEVVCDHVTCSMSPDGNQALLPEHAEITVVGRLNTDFIDIAVVTVNGGLHRPMGGIYHVTLGVNRDAGAKPRHANDVLDRAVELLGEEALHNLPVPLPLGPARLRHYETAKSPKARREREYRREPPEETVTVALDNGLCLEKITERDRIRHLWIKPTGRTYAVEVTDRKTGALIVSKGEGASSAQEALEHWDARTPPGLRSGQ